MTKKIRKDNSKKKKTKNINKIKRKNEENQLEIDIYFNFFTHDE
jgi:hypothetical protein